MDSQYLIWIIVVIILLWVFISLSLKCGPSKIPPKDPPFSERIPKPLKYLYLNNVTTANTTPELSLTSTLENGLSIVLYNNGTIIDTNLWQLKNASYIQFNSPLDEGKYRFTYRLRNEKGELSNISESLNLDIYVTVPDIVSLSIQMLDDQTNKAHVVIEIKEISSSLKAVFSFNEDEIEPTEISSSENRYSFDIDINAAATNMISYQYESEERYRTDPRVSTLPISYPFMIESISLNSENTLEVWRDATIVSPFTETLLLDLDDSINSFSMISSSNLKKSSIFQLDNSFKFLPGTDYIFRYRLSSSTANFDSVDYIFSLLPPKDRDTKIASSGINITLLMTSTTKFGSLYGLIPAIAIQNRSYLVLDYEYDSGADKISGDMTVRFYKPKSKLAPYRSVMVFGYYDPTTSDFFENSKPSIVEFSLDSLIKISPAKVEDNSELTLEIPNWRSDVQYDLYLSSSAEKSGVKLSKGTHYLYNSEKHRFTINPFGWNGTYYFRYSCDAIEILSSPLTINVTFSEEPTSQTTGLKINSGYLLSPDLYEEISTNFDGSEITVELSFDRVNILLRDQWQPAIILSSDEGSYTKLDYTPPDESIQSKSLTYSAKSRGVIPIVSSFQVLYGYEHISSGRFAIRDDAKRIELRINLDYLVNPSGYLTYRGKKYENFESPLVIYDNSLPKFAIKDESSTTAKSVIFPYIEMDSEVMLAWVAYTDRDGDDKEETLYEAPLPLGAYRFNYYLKYDRPVKTETITKNNTNGLSPPLYLRISDLPTPVTPTDFYIAKEGTLFIATENMYNRCDAFLTVTFTPKDQSKPGVDIKDEYGTYSDTSGTYSLTYHGLKYEEGVYSISFYYANYNRTQKSAPSGTFIYSTIRPPALTTFSGSTLFLQDNDILLKIPNYNSELTYKFYLDGADVELSINKYTLDKNSGNITISKSAVADGRTCNITYSVVDGITSDPLTIGNYSSVTNPITMALMNTQNKKLTIRLNSAIPPELSVGISAISFKSKKDITWTDYDYQNLTVRNFGSGIEVDGKDVDFFDLGEGFYTITYYCTDDSDNKSDLRTFIFSYLPTYILPVISSISIINSIITDDAKLIVKAKMPEGVDFNKYVDVNYNFREIIRYSYEGKEYKIRDPDTSGGTDGTPYTLIFDVAKSYIGNDTTFNPPDRLTKSFDALFQLESFYNADPYYEGGKVNITPQFNSINLVTNESRYKYYEYDSLSRIFTIRFTIDGLISANIIEGRDFKLYMSDGNAVEVIPFSDNNNEENLSYSFKTEAGKFLVAVRYPVPSEKTLDSIPHTFAYTVKRDSLLVSETSDIVTLTTWPPPLISSTGSAIFFANIDEVKLYIPNHDSSLKYTFYFDGSKLYTDGDEPSNFISREDDSIIINSWVLAEERTYEIAYSTKDRIISDPFFAEYYRTYREQNAVIDTANNKLTIKLERPLSAGLSYFIESIKKKTEFSEDGIQVLNKDIDVSINGADIIVIASKNASFFTTKSALYTIEYRYVVKNIKSRLCIFKYMTSPTVYDITTDGRTTIRVKTDNLESGEDFSYEIIYDYLGTRYKIVDPEVLPYIEGSEKLDLDFLIYNSFEEKNASQKGPQKLFGTFSGFLGIVWKYGKNITAYSNMREIVGPLYDPMTLVKINGQNYNFDISSRIFTINFTIPYPISLLFTEHLLFQLYMENEQIAVNVTQIDDKTTLATIRYKFESSEAIVDKPYRFHYTIDNIKSTETSINLTAPEDKLDVPTGQLIYEKDIRDTNISEFINPLVIYDSLPKFKIVNQDYNQSVPSESIISVQKQELDYIVTFSDVDGLKVPEKDFEDGNYMFRYYLQYDKVVKGVSNTKEEVGGYSNKVYLNIRTSELRSSKLSFENIYGSTVIFPNEDIKLRIPNYSSGSDYKLFVDGNDLTQSCTFVNDIITLNASSVPSPSPPSQIYNFQYGVDNILSSSFGVTIFSNEPPSPQKWELDSSVLILEVGTDMPTNDFKLSLSVVFIAGKDKTTIDKSEYTVTFSRTSIILVSNSQGDPIFFNSGNVGIYEITYQYVDKILTSHTSSPTTYFFIHPQIVSAISINSDGNIITVKTDRLLPPGPDLRFMIRYDYFGIRYKFQNSDVSYDMDGRVQDVIFNIKDAPKENAPPEGIPKKLFGTVIVEASLGFESIDDPNKNGYSESYPIDGLLLVKPPALTSSTESSIFFRDADVILSVPNYNSTSVYKFYLDDPVAELSSNKYTLDGSGKITILRSTFSEDKTYNIRFSVDGITSDSFFAKLYSALLLQNAVIDTTNKKLTSTLSNPIPDDLSLYIESIHMKTETGEDTVFNPDVDFSVSTNGADIVITSKNDRLFTEKIALYTIEYRYDDNSDENNKSSLYTFTNLSSQPPSLNVSAITTDGTVITVKIGNFPYNPYFNEVVSYYYNGTSYKIKNIASRQYDQNLQVLSLTFDVSKSYVENNPSYLPEQKLFGTFSGYFGFEGVFDKNIKAYSGNYQIKGPLYDPMTLVMATGGKNYDFNDTSRIFTIKFTIPHSMTTIGNKGLELYKNNYEKIDEVVTPTPYIRLSYVLTSFDDKTTLATITYKPEGTAAITNNFWEFKYTLNGIESKHSVSINLIAPEVKFDVPTGQLIYEKDTTNTSQSTPLVIYDRLPKFTIVKQSYNEGFLSKPIPIISVQKQNDQGILAKYTATFSDINGLKVPSTPLVYGIYMFRYYLQYDKVVNGVSNTEGMQGGYSKEVYLDIRNPVVRDSMLSLENNKMFFLNEDIKLRIPNYSSGSDYKLFVDGNDLTQSCTFVNDIITLNSSSVVTNPLLNKQICNFQYRVDNTRSLSLSVTICPDKPPSPQKGDFGNRSLILTFDTHMPAADVNLSLFVDFIAGKDRTTIDESVYSVDFNSSTIKLISNLSASQLFTSRNVGIYEITYQYVDKNDSEHKSSPTTCLIDPALQSSTGSIVFFRGADITLSIPNYNSDLEYIFYLDDDLLNTSKYTLSNDKITLASSITTFPTYKIYTIRYRTVNTNISLPFLIGMNSLDNPGMSAHWSNYQDSPNSKLIVVLKEIIPIPDMNHLNLELSIKLIIGEITELIDKQLYDVDILPKEIEITTKYDSGTPEESKLLSAALNYDFYDVKYEIEYLFSDKLDGNNKSSLGKFSFLNPPPPPLFN